MNPIASLILPPLGAVYRVITQSRVRAYEAGWLPVSKLAAPVISVGNLTTGGTGKTPLVDWICRVIDSNTNQSQKRLCVLTRGYGRTDTKAQVVVSDGVGLLANEAESGDEAYLLARNLLGIAAVIANADRYEAGKWAIQNLGSEVFVLDDGFQHLRLARDLNIAVIDATNPWGGGDLLPSGRLREKPRGLKRADCVVITRSEQAEKVDRLKEEVEQIAGEVPVFVSRMVTTHLTDLKSEQNDAERLRSVPVVAFCGVGNPQSFFSHLRSEGFSIVHTRSFPDHHHYTQANIDRLLDDARTHKAQALITTAKDATKLASCKFEIPCLVLEISVAIDDEDRLMEMIRSVTHKKDK
ncbi:MAG TPA: tetraacyldisaccharide 4'-kinase [Pyrinomonadaceae bacterium]|nr:tetraacyldisaccharide 4'-kinase [Pyrinomonadaceae bacterium]